MRTKPWTHAVRLFAVALAIGLAASPLPLSSGTVHAEGEKVKIGIEAGYDGQGREGSHVPVRISLTNPGKTLEGDLVLTAVSPAGGKDVSYVRHLELPEGSSKTVWLSLPALSYTVKNNEVKFMEGGVSKGKAVALDGKTAVSLRVTGYSLIGGVSRDPDTLSFLSGIRNPDLTSVPLTPDDLPDEAGLLSGLDALVLNDISSDALRPEQTAAIENWVKSGGMLILAGGAQYAKTAQAFPALAPLRPEGTAQRDSLPALAAFAGKELKPSAPVTLSTGTLQGAEVLLSEGDIPLIAVKQAGLGKVYYWAYDLADPSLNGWNGNASLWQAFFPFKQTNQGSGQMAFANNIWQIDNALNLFPSIKAPKLGLLALLFAGYALLVAPILYFVLKKLDRREWAWGIIPLTAILATGVIYVVGAADKSSVLVHELNRFELDGSGGGRRISDAAVFVPNGGKYSIGLPASASAMPFDTSQNMGNVSTALSGEPSAYLYSQPDSLKVEWRGISYWSVRKTHWENLREESLGKFRATATFAGNQLTGEIANETGQALSDVYVVWNGSLISVGDLAKGESKSYSGSYTGGFSNGDIGFRMFPNTNGSRSYPFEREQNLISHYFTQLNAAGKDSAVRVIGWSKDQNADFQAKGASRFDRLNLYSQEIPVQAVSGNRISVPFGSVKPQVTGSGNSAVFINGDYLEITAGSIEVEYRLPLIGGTASYQKLTLAEGNSKGGVQVELKNNKTGKWVPVTYQGGQFVLQDSVGDYLDNGRLLRLKATSTAQMPYWLPQLSLEGTVSP